MAKIGTFYKGNNMGAQQGYEYYSPFGYYSSYVSSSDYSHACCSTIVDDIYFAYVDDKSEFFSVFGYIDDPAAPYINYMVVCMSNNASAFRQYVRSANGYNYYDVSCTVRTYNGNDYYLRPLISRGKSQSIKETTGIYNLEHCTNIADAIANSGIRPIGTMLYPITYHYTNSTVSGLAEAAVGDIVTVSAIPDVGYDITDASMQILVTNNDIAVPYTWDSTNNRITFTMPDPT